MRKGAAFLLLLCVAAMSSCAGRPPVETPPGSQALLPPEEPFQKLAWLVAERVASLQVTAVSVSNTEDSAGLPPAAIPYFRQALKESLAQRRIAVDESAAHRIYGTFHHGAGELVFSYQLLEGSTPILLDDATIPEDSRLQETIRGFRKPANVENPPMSTVRLAEAPLDVCPLCKDGTCKLFLLFAHRIERMDWGTGVKESVDFPRSSLAPIVSRAPSGKIVSSTSGFTILENDLTAPLSFDTSLRPIPAPEQSFILPRPEPGKNTFVLADGRFYDFEILPESRQILAIETSRHLSVATQGVVATSTETVGGVLLADLPVIYTSSDSLPGQPDAILKFRLENDRLSLESRRPLPSEILDLAMGDVNGDGRNELLCTVRTETGALIEVIDAF